jgi:choline dehydrogenase
MDLIYAVPLKHSLDQARKSLWFVLKEALPYVLYREGLFLCQSPQVAIFANSQQLDDRAKVKAGVLGANLVPDIEIMPCQIAPPQRTETLKERFRPDEGSFMFYCCVLQPSSVGTVRLTSTDPRVRPECDLGFFNNKADFTLARAVVRLGLALGAQVKEQGYPIRPIEVPKSDSDEDIDEFIRSSVGTVYHYASSCRMLPKEQGGVVDSRLRVHGVHGLRIADASIFPNIPAAHTQAPSVMVAERCADFINAGE